MKISVHFVTQTSLDICVRRLTTRRVMPWFRVQLLHATPAGCENYCTQSFHTWFYVQLLHAKYAAMFAGIPTYETTSKDISI